MPSLRSLPPTKKRKLATKKNEGRSDELQAIAEHETRLLRALAERASLNSLADLLGLALNTKDAQTVSKAIYALYRVSVSAISGGALAGGDDQSVKTVKKWLEDCLATYVDFLAGLMKDEERHLRISALQILFSLQKHLSAFYSSIPVADSAHSQPRPRPQYHISHLRKIVNALLLCPPSARGGKGNEESEKVVDSILDPDILVAFCEQWLCVYDDVRWFFLREAATLMNKNTHAAIPLNLLAILERLHVFPASQADIKAWWVPEMGTKPPKSRTAALDHDGLDESEENLQGGDEEVEDDWRKFFDEDPAIQKEKPAAGPSLRLHQMTVHQSVHALSSHRAMFTRVWLALLPRLGTPGENMERRKRGAQSKALAVRVLSVMHRSVVPHLTRPVLTMDWVGASVDYGGSVGLLALNALWVLMKEYNLDYPAFYTRLYSFLDREVLHSKHRARFFRLTELFLSSTHLPAALLASFMKRLARLSLTAPPAAVIMLIPFTYNILKRHPALMPMIHRVADADGDLEDPFLPNEPNPLSTRAIESSLWELLSHRSNYHAGTATLCRIFGEPFTKPHYVLEEFLDHAYGTLFDTEIKRKIKKEPPVGMSGTLVWGTWDNEDVAESADADAVKDLWVFG